jgi:phosphopantetheinyl transferase
VDVESLRDLPSHIAQRAMTARERRACDSLPEAERLPRFFALWVAKEAVTKAAGRGLRQPFEGFDASDIVQLPRGGDGICDTHWMTALPAPRDGFFAAIASAAPIRGLRLWSLLDAPGG